MYIYQVVPKYSDLLNTDKVHLATKATQFFSNSSNFISSSNFNSSNEKAAISHMKNNTQISNQQHGPLLKSFTFPHHRFGNKCYQYCFLYCASQKTNRTPTIGTNSSLLDVFGNISAVRIEPVQRKSLPTRKGVSSFNGSRFHMFYPEKFDQIRRSNDTWVGAYFMSWKYFQDCEQDIKTQFTLHSELQKLVTVYLQKVGGAYANIRNILIDEVTFIGTHVRLGDKRRLKHLIKNDLGSAPLSYIEHALSYYYRQYKYPLFIVASDELDWCKKNMKYKKYTIKFSPFISYQEDFALLTMCNHSLMTVGSFGWFSSWLAGGEVVYYGNFPGKRGFYPDFYPPQWHYML